MVRVTNAVACHKKTKRILKKAKGYYGDRKNHLKLSQVAIMQADSFNYVHRKQRKRDFRKLWTIRIGVASKLHGMSYSRLMYGLKRAGCQFNRKVLADMAIRDPHSFGAVATVAKQALVA
jgi:large subunit ribosomal protein L20